MSKTNFTTPTTQAGASDQPGSVQPAGSASDVERIRKEHAEIAAAYAAHRDTMNGDGLPYGPCQCDVCRPNDKSDRRTITPDEHDKRHRRFAEVTGYA